MHFCWKGPHPGENVLGTSKIHPYDQIVCFVIHIRNTVSYTCYLLTESIRHCISVSYASITSAKFCFSCHYLAMLYKTIPYSLNCPSGRLFQLLINLKSALVFFHFAKYLLRYPIWTLVQSSPIVFICLILL